ncbi:MAG: hypothetical protein HGB04_01915 [Chlorobiaceae bacterium]|nr:hypothetical protein [Chlorobiaceae bacterium]
MNKKLVKSGLISAVLLSGFAPALHAGTGDLAIGAKAGTLGIGGEATLGLLPGVNARAGYNAYNYDGSTTKDNIGYNYRLKLGSMPLLLDLHPFPMSGFRISGGFIVNNNRVDATGKPQDSYNIGGTTYTSGQVGTLTGKIEFDSTAPYLGIGWGNAVAKGLPLTICVDAGVMFQGTPKVSLSANGTLASDPAFKANLAKEEATIRDTTDSLKYYPVVSLGLAYRF